MATDISSLLLHVLGSDSKGSEEWVNDLPDSLKKLTEAIGKATAGAEKGSKGKGQQSESEKRSEEFNLVMRQFGADLRETARVLGDLNKTEQTSLKAAERTAKEGAAYRKMVEAANKRADKLGEVERRQGAERQGNLLNLVGAIGGKGLQGIVSNFVNASRQTEKDIAQIGEARYADLVGAAADTRAEAEMAADRRVAASDDALLQAQKAYASAMEKVTAEAGEAVMTMMGGKPLIEAAAKAEDAYAAAQAERDRIQKEGESRIKAAKAGSLPSESPIATGAPGVAGAGPLAAPLSDIATAIREGAGSTSGLILDEATRRAAEISKVEAEVAKANTEAQAAVNAAGDALTKAVEATRTPPVEGGSSAQAQYAGGLQAAAAAETGRAVAEAEYAKAQASNIETKRRATDEKAAAIAEEEKATAQAFEKKQSGSLVSAEEAKGIGRANMMNMAVTPPAVAIIAKSVEKFAELFPVIGQAGNAVVEMSSIIPATITALGFKTASVLMQMATGLKEAISKPDVSKRYEKSDALVRAETAANRTDKKAMSRGALFAEAYAQRAETYRKEMKPADDTMGLFEVSPSRAMPRANAPKAYTTEMTPSASSGITHGASARADVMPPPPAPIIQPIPEREQALGVVPISASNRNIDEWR